MLQKDKTCWGSHEITEFRITEVVSERQVPRNVFIYGDQPSVFTLDGTCSAWVGNCYYCINIICPRSSKLLPVTVSWMMLDLWGTFKNKSCQFSPLLLGDKRTAILSSDLKEKFWRKALIMGLIFVIQAAFLLIDYVWDLVSLWFYHLFLLSEMLGVIFDGNFLAIWKQVLGLTALVLKLNIQWI